MPSGATPPMSNSDPSLQPTDVKTDGGRLSPKNVSAAANEPSGKLGVASKPELMEVKTEALEIKQEIMETSSVPPQNTAALTPKQEISGIQKEFFFVCLFVCFPQLSLIR